MNETGRPTAGEVPLERVVRVGAATTLVDAARLLAITGASTLLVDTVPPTECTEHDIVRAVAEGVPDDAPVVDVVRATPLFVECHATVDAALAAMLQRGRRAVVVVDAEGNALGLLTLAVAIEVLLQGPPWLGALRLALRIEGSTP